MSSRKLSQLLVHRSKVASILDWNKTNSSIMALSLSKTCIGVATSKHPTHWNIFCESDSLSLNIQPANIYERKEQIENMKLAASQIHEIVIEHNVCAFLIDWPVTNLGRCGASCGQTLFQLENLLDSSAFISKEKPFAFVNFSREADINNEEDTWGRVWKDKVCPVNNDAQIQI